MPLEIRGAHFLIRSAQLVRGTRLEQALVYCTERLSLCRLQHDATTRQPVARVHLRQLTLAGRNVDERVSYVTLPRGNQKWNKVSD